MRQIEGERDVEQNKPASFALDKIWW